MFKLSVRGIRDHKARFAATTFAVVLGVSFVVASFVLADTIRTAFDDLFVEINAGVDLSVRSSSSIGSEGPEGTQRRPVPEDLLDEVQETEGVGVAAGQVGGFARVITPEGEPVTTTGAPLLGVAWGPDELAPINLEAGSKPVGPGEIAVDRGTADEYDLEVGDQVRVEVAAGVVDAELVGVFTFGETNSLLGARVTAFAPVAAQAAFGSEGFFQSIDVALAPGADAVEVARQLEDRLPERFEIVTGETVADENSADVAEFIDVFGNVLLGFAAVALFVSAFYIHNTFTIILGQRLRELGLLRAVGASPAQVTGSVLGEAVVIGVVASIVGVGFGLLTALGLQALLGAAGLDFPASGLVLQPRTWVFALVVGMGVTLLSSLAPARRAGRISPVAAMSPTRAMPSPSRTRQFLIGSVLVGIGVALLLLGLVVADGAPAVIGSLGLGALAVFVGTARLSPLFAGPVAGVLGAPLRRVFRMPGHLATENAVRNPGRTASAASALMIGLALVTMASVTGRSMTATFADAIEETLTADVIVSAEGFGSFTPAFAEELAERPEVGAITAVRFASFRFEGEETGVDGVDPQGAAALFDPDLRAGSLADLDRSTIAIHEDPADDLGLEVGDRVEVEFPRSGEATLQVVAVYGDSTLLGNYVVSLEGWGERFNTQTDSIVVAGAAEGTSVEKLQAGAEEVAEGHPAVQVENRAEFRQSQEDQFSQILVAVNGMLGLAVVIAGLGIANTMALTVFERTRELGLLRAVGMTSRQARRMIRWEAVVVAVFGGVLGVAVGLLFGLVAVAALPSSVAGRLVVPGTTIVFTLIAAGIVGLLAAIFPARRAGRLRVLEAIAHE